jgi:long-chain acyl-CoA synthetase
MAVWLSEMLARIPLLPSAFGPEPALQDDKGTCVSYDELRLLSERWADHLAGPRGLVFLYIRNDVASVAALLGALAAGHAVSLCDPNLPAEQRACLETCYQPDWLLEPGCPQIIRGPLNSDPVAMDPALALLVSTSGSTGSPKLVRLTLAAIEANAAGIADVLSIKPDDVAAGHLPLHYSYGLSVLTSHLCRGARVFLTDRSLMHREFWPSLRDARVTHFPGVPFHYVMMAKLGFARLKLGSLRTMTQAGGSLNVIMRRQAHAFMSERGGAFYVLYGQTEAAPRMATLQHNDFPLAEDSVGTALPGCRFEIFEPDENDTGEVVFYGANVMLGYAEARQDLALGDALKGRLQTGDIGRLDGSGRLYLTGRIKRFGKIYGLRVNLDELELEASTIVPSAAVQFGEGLILFIEGCGDETGDAEQSRRILDHLISRFTIPRASYEIRIIEEIPLTPRGKVDYAALEIVG